MLLDIRGAIIRLMYKRVLLKLSGEQLQGKYNNGVDTERIKWIAQEVKQALGSGTQIVVMIGGGNYARGAQLSEGGAVSRVTADNAGMLATLMNGLVLSDVFNHEGVAARTLTNIKADQVADQFTHRRALSHLDKNRVVVVAGGIGRPYLTTDTAAVSLALELNCDAILKATKVDGVYDSDPVNNPSAKKFDKITYQEALQQPDIQVMDKAALGLAMDYEQKVVVFKLLDAGNIHRAVTAGDIGTIISA